MKVYVDELPKNCAECELCGRFKPPVERPEIECMHCNMAKTFNSISPFCPLKSLADHDKQVRKDVCEKIKNEARNLGGIRQGEKLFINLDNVVYLINELKREFVDDPDIMIW